MGFKIGDRVKIKLRNSFYDYYATICDINKFCGQLAIYLDIDNGPKNYGICYEHESKHYLELIEIDQYEDWDD